jgi:hypothetical protein
MTLPLIAFLVAAIIPIFFGKIRSAPFWLSGGLCGAQRAGVGDRVHPHATH